MYKFTEYAEGGNAPSDNIKLKINLHVLMVARLKFDVTVFRSFTSTGKLPVTLYIGL